MPACSLPPRDVFPHTTRTSHHVSDIARNLLPRADCFLPFGGPPLLAPRAFTLVNSRTYFLLARLDLASRAQVVLRDAGPSPPSKRATVLRGCCAQLRMGGMGGDLRAVLGCTCAALARSDQVASREASSLPLTVLYATRSCPDLSSLRMASSNAAMLTRAALASGSLANTRGA